MVPMNKIINTAINMIFISVSSSFLQFFYQFLAHCPVVFVAAQFRENVGNGALSIVDFSATTDRRTAVSKHS